MSEPTPTGQEWTAERVRTFFGWGDDYEHDKNPFRSLAFAINSALAAEREKWEQLLDRQDEGHAEYVGKMTNELTTQIADRKQLSKELEEARGLLKHWRSYFGPDHPRGKMIDAFLAKTK